MVTDLMWKTSILVDWFTRPPSLRTQWASSNMNIIFYGIGVPVITKTTHCLYNGNSYTGISSERTKTALGGRMWNKITIFSMLYSTNLIMHTSVNVVSIYFLWIPGLKFINIYRRVVCNKILDPVMTEPGCTELLISLLLLISEHISIRRWHLRFKSKHINESYTRWINHEFIAWQVLRHKHLYGIIVFYCINMKSHKFDWYFDGLMQKRRNSSELAMLNKRYINF